MASVSKAEGVWSNCRFMHVCSCVMGTVVQVVDHEGGLWEGVFESFSPEFVICLDNVVKLDAKNVAGKEQQFGPNIGHLYTALKEGAELQNRVFFKWDNIVRLSALDADLTYVTRDTSQIATDAQISGFDESKMGEHRELQSWDDEPDEPTNNNPCMLTLEDDSKQNNSESNGWDPQEMFNYNANRFKVVSTYDDSLQPYTVPLPKSDSKEWRERAQKAEAVAREINSNQRSQNRLAKEDGDEEDLYSAVHRPHPNPNINMNIKPNPVHRSPNPVHRSPNPVHRSPNQMNQNRPRAPHARYEHNRRGQQNRYNQHSSTAVQQLRTFQKSMNLVSSSSSAAPSKTSAPASSGSSAEPSKTSAPTSSGNSAETSKTSAPTSGNPAEPSKTSTPTSSGISAEPSKTSTPTSSGNSAAPPQHQPSPASASSTDCASTDPRSELVRKSKLNPNAKEFVYKPSRPALIPPQMPQPQHPNLIYMRPTHYGQQIPQPHYTPMMQQHHYHQQMAQPMYPPPMMPPAHYTQQMPQLPHFPPQMPQNHYPQQQNVAWVLQSWDAVPYDT